MDPELVFGAIQTVLSILTVAIAPVQLFQQWHRPQVVVCLSIARIYLGRNLLTLVVHRTTIKFG